MFWDEMPVGGDNTYMRSFYKHTRLSNTHLHVRRKFTFSAFYSMDNV